MRYWDSSALVPLLVTESATGAMEALLAADAAVVTWWGTPIECTSAIARRGRDDPDARVGITTASMKLAALEADWSEVSPSERLRALARRLLRVHDLRAADALQLAAGLAALDTRTEPLPFVTLDDRLALAASREGFPILGLAER